MKKILSLLIISSFGLPAALAQDFGDSEEMKKQKSYSYSEIYFGWANLSNSDGRATDEGTPFTTELEYWNSTTWGFGFGQNNQIGESKFNVRYGLQFNWHFLRMPGNTTLMKDSIAGDPAVFFVKNPTYSYEKSAFRIGYIDLPILFEFNSANREGNDGLVIALGGYGGLRLDANTKVKYTDAFGDDIKDISHNNYLSNNFRYGLMGQVGFGAFRFTMRTDLNTLFDQDYQSPDYSIVVWTVGYVFP